ncbi:MAG: hypothetical protein A2X08_06800 [Bacteroidetes bacterium GWA2_32_17]|nr:MAG: hypothetical protein A2X08_06800 [Bacteroidetes bacterium GWA2_32_17]
MLIYKNKKIFFLLILILISSNIYTQDLKIIDSLNKVIIISKDIKTKIDCYNLIAKEYITNSAFDSINFYAKKALDLSKQINYDKGIGTSYSNIAAIEYDKGNNDKALELYSIGLRYFRKANFDIGIARIYTSLGNIYINSGNYSKALNTYINSQKIIDKLLDKDSSSINLNQTKANNLNNLGNVYFYLNNYDEVLIYYFEAFTLYKKINDKADMANALNNIGLIYRVKGETEKSIDFRMKALEIFKELNNIEGLAYCNMGLGNLYYESNQHDKSINFFNQALKYFRQMDSKKGIIMIYVNFSEIFAQQKLFSKSIAYLDTSLKLSFEIGSNDLRKDIYKTYSEIYKNKMNYKLSLEYQTLYINLKDSILNNDNQKIIADIQTKYDTEKKEKQILLFKQEKIIREADLLKKSKEVQKQKFIIYTFIFGFIIIIIFSTLLYKQFHEKKKAYTQLEIKNSEILQKNEEISTQRDEIEAQRDEITTQRDLVTIQKEHIEEIHKEVTDSINYAKRIQEAVLPVSDSSRSILGEHFILFKPKDIVSGDFYWATQITTMGHAPLTTRGHAHLLIVAVADCTGHGVPGAFMSMLGISFLNEIVLKEEVRKANQILNHLRKEIINALQQKGISGEQKDGMDISLLVVNTETKECQWAGANNPLYIVSSMQSAFGNEMHELPTATASCQLYELKGDKMPIAIYERMDDFTNHEFTLQKGDCVYLFSDGYADQFGGPKSKKFMYKQLKELLLINCQRPMQEQKETLDVAIGKWKGEKEQIDDITVLGIKI